MKIKRFFEQFTQDPRGTLIGIALVLLTWTLALAVVTWFLFFYMERGAKPWFQLQRGVPRPLCWSRRQVLLRLM
jgi:hypothetical protein